MTAKGKVVVSESEEMKSAPKEALTCGIIMPIATMSPEYPESHWIDVRHIIDSAVKRAGFIPRIVSESEDSTIIHKSIINNIYNDSIIVCDVSNKNANVMFELGMRLAFNKPIVIIKDDKTGYSFDTSNIQHLGYRKDLRHSTVEKFIDDLANKIKATYEAPQQENYQSFLSHFGKFEVAMIENKSLQEGEAIQKLLDKVTGLEQKISSLNYNTKPMTTNNILKFKIPKPRDKNDLIKLIEAINNKIIPSGEVAGFNNNLIEVNLDSGNDANDILTLRKDIESIIEDWVLPF